LAQGHPSASTLHLLRASAFAMAGLFTWCVTSTGKAAEETELRETVPTVVRTAEDARLSPEEALLMLKQGNERYTGTSHAPRKVEGNLRQALTDRGQNPAAVVIGCSDSRCPPETLFDVMPGDLFVLRNAGNALATPEGSIVASTEYAVGALGTKLVLVLGHTKCGAIVGATKVALCPPAEKGTAGQSHLEKYLAALGPCATIAKQNLPTSAGNDDIVSEAIKVNVLRTIEKLIEFSPSVRAKVASGEVQLHGGIYDIMTGEVTFMGQHPEVAVLAKAA